MWSEVFLDPWASSFPSQRNPFASFGGFYGEGPFTFLENPSYFPNQKTKRSPDRKKTRPAETLSSEPTDIPVCCDAREDPAAVKSHMKLKERNNSSLLKLSKAEDDNPVKVEPFNKEDDSKENLKGANEAFTDKRREIDDLSDQCYDNTGAHYEQLLDNNSASLGNSKAASSEESSLKESEAKFAEDHKLNEIKTQLSRARELVPRVEDFQGHRKDKEFLYLEEHFTLQILALDLINTDGLEKVKLARKEAVKEILSIISDLETCFKTVNDKKLNQKFGMYVL